MRGMVRTLTGLMTRLKRLLALAVSKSATIHLAKSLAKACAPAMRVNSVSAGVMMTEWSKGFPEEQIKSTIEANALQKLAEVDDVAKAYGQSMAYDLSRTHPFL